MGEPYVAVTKGVHREQIVSMTQLKSDHLLGGSQVGFPLDDGFDFVLALLFLVLSRQLVRQIGSSFHELLQQQRVFSHSLHRLQQITGQVHLVPELELLRLEECRAVFSHQGIRVRLVLVVQRVEIEFLLL